MSMPYDQVPVYATDNINQTHTKDGHVPNVSQSVDISFDCIPYVSILQHEKQKYKKRRTMYSM